VVKRALKAQESAQVRLSLRHFARNPGEDMGIRLFNLSLIHIAVGLVLFCSLAVSCSKEDDVSLILYLIQEGAKLAEGHHVQELMDLTTEDFQATPGPLDGRETSKILWWAFRHYGDFKILYPEPAIDLGPKDDASARVYFMIVKTELTYPKLDKLYKEPKAWLEEVGENADLYRLTLEFVRKNSDWTVKSALLEPFKGLGFGR
jgi:hypothetical protein